MEILIVSSKAPIIIMKNSISTFFFVFLFKMAFSFLQYPSFCPIVFSDSFCVYLALLSLISLHRPNSRFSVSGKYLHPMSPADKPAVWDFPQ